MKNVKKFKRAGGKNVCEFVKIAFCSTAQYNK